MIMNSYLSREEKESFVRLLCLATVLEKAVDTYAGVESTDKGFLGELRHARTRLDKAIKMRRDALDAEADDGLVASVAKVHLMFLPTPEAKKAHEEMLKLQNVLPINADDFNDWYGFVINSTCRVCQRTDYEQCDARRILTKYGVWPIDPEAKTKCQYSYVDVPGIEQVEQWLALRPKAAADAVPAAQVVTTANVADSEDLQGDGADAAALLPVTLGLVEGKALVIELPEELAVALMDELRDHGRHSRGICAAHTGMQLIGIDMREVVTVTGGGIEDGVWQRCEPLGVYQANREHVRQDIPRTDERELFHVECHCGAEYNCSMNAGRPTARCRDCQAPVFADRTADPIDVSGSAATLMTNRYWVERGA